ncbi:hypothetical protein KIN20_017502 [Parelaphostrongylus tenuis]|uniref:Uncharacterized protein n=1 Tax=Parelaphostrongylus tenuis TaxID=148309 RepID=A0AAD5QNP4_PARTN|nr:hypothetical protein KIN20_017502 [Parelaphostrongylus tenuis]
MLLRLNPWYLFHSSVSILLAALFFNALKMVEAELELDASAGLVECLQCVQLWRSVSQRDTKGCGPHAKTCKGNACFMRQCKHCPVYQYMSGCVDLTPWQIADLEVNRRRSELRMRRVGAMLLCEDTFNQTTCICNRRDKCNSIHSQLPFSTYSEGIFKDVINFDQIIADLDPRYLEVIAGYQYRFGRGSTAKSHPLLVSLLPIIVMFKLFS